MSYRQQEENEEAAQQLDHIYKLYDEGKLDDEYSDWLCALGGLKPPICNGDTLIYHIEHQTYLDDFIDFIAFGKNSVNKAMA